MSSFLVAMKLQNGSTIYDNCLHKSIMARLASSMVQQRERAANLTNQADYNMKSQPSRIHSFRTSEI